MDAFRLDGLTALVTGAGTGIGAALAQALAAAGADVACHGNKHVPDDTKALAADAVRNQQITVRIPAGRWGEPADLGGAAVFLAARASDYVHGHVLVVDGGWMGR
jgi:2-deoxy-D-gluconate 3-dehydrogenase